MMLKDNVLHPSQYGELRGMKVIVKFKGDKPPVHHGLRASKEGFVVKGTWSKLIMGHRIPDEVPMKSDEILMRVNAVRPTLCIGVAKITVVG